jgi:peptidoglycan glycosyltransferase
MVAEAERFGFNSPPTLYETRALKAVELPSSTLPTELSDDLEEGVTAIGQGEVLATPLQLASISQTIANGGKRSPTSLVRDRGLRSDFKPVRVTSEGTANTLRDLMVQVVANGTGTAAALPNAQVAGKTGTAELGAKPLQPGEQPEPGEEPEQEVDAWFTAFAPAGSPKLAVAVMLVNASGDGGEVAAPLAREVLAAGLG